MNPGTEGSEVGVVLVVDDEAAIRNTLERFLARMGHRVETAASAEEARGRLSQGPYDVVVTDLQMPRTTGLDLLSEIHSRWSGTRVILISGRAQATDAAAAIERGVDRLLLKPFTFDDLQVAVGKALAERRAQTKIAKEREILEARLRMQETTSKIWVLRAAHALAAAVEAKDAYTAGHATRVTAYAMNIAEVIGGIDVSSFRLAGDLHDVGKIGVPDTILNKPGRLTEEEYALVRKHPEIGARILDSLIDDPIVIGVVRWHHERWDGRGYPDGLEGERTPLPARILAVADTLDAMTSSRAYREGLSWNVAVAEIRRCSGSQFDPQVVEAFDTALPRLEALFASFRSSEGVGNRSPAVVPDGD